MKTILLCDSGLGGLDIAAKLIGQVRSRGTGSFRLIYFNAWPHPQCGYNQLKNDQERCQVFAAALDGMARFHPDFCLVACNTLSIVYRKIAADKPLPFPVVEMLRPGSEFFAEAMQRQPELRLLILGTDTTIRSGMYTEQLIQAGILPERLASLACPGLATALEDGFESSAVRQKIAFAAEQARAMILEDTPLALALCCTHFGYAENLFKTEFAARFRQEPQLLNPNESILRQPELQSCLQQAGNPQVSVEFFSRFPMPQSKMRIFAEYFKGCAPELSEALLQARCDEALFTLPEGIF